jgi:uncharacterized beta-barrel protein YwiB (DUF1934 family)
MRKVVVTVVGTQTDAAGEASRIELMALGTCHDKGGVTYITYRETELSGLEGTTTLLKIYGDHISLVRMGAVEQKQEFYPGETRHSTYITPFGCMKLSVATKCLDIAVIQGLGSLFAAYDLEINGQWQSSNTLSVKIREEE